MDRNHVAVHCDTLSALVALRKESVDRNINKKENPGETIFVALRKESVDRNKIAFKIGIAPVVALRKESVDRNREQFKYVVQCRKSLSARRAWIEIAMYAL